MAQVSVFADTSALYALLVRSERGHRAVASAFRELVQSGRLIRTSNYVILETVALLQHRFGLEAVRDFQNGIVPILRVHWIQEDLHRRAVDRLLRTDRRTLSLVDCSSFLLMDSEGIHEALALDVDFAHQGYRVLPRV
jgi:predicted nucleic acid-binding protein